MTKHRKKNATKRAIRHKRKSRRNLVRGGAKADREQSTDFIFFKPNINPDSGYTHYIIYNNIPVYQNYMDFDLAYQIQAIESELRGYSENRPLTTAYKYRMKVNSDHARTEAQKDAENEALKKKIEKLEKKQEELKGQLKGEPNVDDKNKETAKKEK
jgi:hypothetical protein